jgi:hypothetical protein
MIHYTPLTATRFSALFVVAQPKRAIPSASRGQTQMEFAKRAFLDSYRSAAHTQEKINGVAVVFLGDKTGMAAPRSARSAFGPKAVFPTKVFLERCFLSPPDAFRDMAKH